MVIDAAELIITRNEHGFNLRKLVSLANFLFFWGVVIYMARSLVTLIGWFVAYYVFDTVATDMGIGDIITIILTFYLPVIGVASLLLYGWASYNRYRFSGMRDKRRVPPPILTMEEVSSYTRLSMDKLSQMQQAKGMICHFDDKSELSDVDCFTDLDDVAEVMDWPLRRIRYASPDYNNDPSPVPRFARVRS